MEMTKIYEQLVVLNSGSKVGSHGVTAEESRIFCLEYLNFNIIQYHFGVVVF